MSEHAHLPAVIGFVHDHIADHRRARGPPPGSAIAMKLFDARPRDREPQRATPCRAPLFASACGTPYCVQRARPSRVGGFSCGADRRSHLRRTLWTWEKIAAIVRTLLPGSWARQARGSRCSSTSWFIPSLTAYISCMPWRKSGLSARTDRGMRFPSCRQGEREAAAGASTGWRQKAGRLMPSL